MCYGATPHFLCGSRQTRFGVRRANRSQRSYCELFICSFDIEGLRTERPFWTLKGCEFLGFTVTDLQNERIVRHVSMGGNGTGDIGVCDSCVAKSVRTRASHR